MPDVQLADNFWLSEFEQASHRPLTAEERSTATWWARAILQPARDALGPIVVSSYVRTRNIGGGAHAAGGGVDVYPLEASMDELFDWIRRNKAGQIGRVIHERNHIHIARRGPERWAGYGGLAFREPTEGRYELVTGILALLVPAVAALLLLLAISGGRGA